MMGTAKYLSPEQVRGRRLDGRADLYSLGLVLYECLAGRVPFLGETDADTALARLQRDPDRPRPPAPDDPARASSTSIHRLLSRNPNHRPATGAELRAELLRVADEPPPDLTPLGRPAATERLDHRPGRARSSAPPARPARSPRTRPGAPPIPGEATPPNPVSRRPRDPTPNAGRSLRAKPAKGLQSRTGPSMVLVLLLLAVALVVALVLWIAIGRNDGGGGAVDDRGSAPHRRRCRRARRTITAITHLRPSPGRRRGERRPGVRGARRREPGHQLEVAVLPRTTMSKDGVGLIVTLNAAGDRHARRSTSATHRSRSRCSDRTPRSPPTDFAGWGPALQNKTFSQVAQRVDVPRPCRPATS